MPARSDGVRRALLMTAATAVLAGGCFRKPKHPTPAPEPITLEMVSHAFSDVDVYVLPSLSGGALRLTTVSGFGKASMRIRTMQLQPGYVLQLELHAIGTNTSWITPSLSVSPGERVRLDINSDATGNLSRSSLYPLPDEGGDGPPPPPSQLR